jgi:hypothetical protein
MAKEAQLITSSELKLANKVSDNNQKKSYHVMLLTRMVIRDDRISYKSRILRKMRVGRKGTWQQQDITIT